jgi:hypothetical protein
MLTDKGAEEIVRQKQIRGVIVGNAFRRHRFARPDLLRPTDETLTAMMPPMSEFMSN